MTTKKTDPFARQKAAEDRAHQLQDEAQRHAHPKRVIGPTARFQFVLRRTNWNRAVGPMTRLGWAWRWASSWSWWARSSAAFWRANGSVFLVVMTGPP